MENIEKRHKKFADTIKTLSAEQVAIIKATVCKDATDMELAFFLNVAKVYELNPFTKEIWAYKDSKGNLIVFAGRDGFLAKAQRDPRWNGIASEIVREGEKFELNVAQGIISHIKDVTSKSRILGAYAICRPKNVEIPTIEWADFETYDKKYNVWKVDPAAMIKKVAEVHALKKAYGISGLQAEEDYQVNNDIAITIDHETKPELKTIGYVDQLIRKSTLDDDAKEVMYDKISDPEITNMELENITREVQNAQPKLFR
jgi:phage recombination protein Bet